MRTIEPIEKLKEKQVSLVEVELMLTPEELQRYGAFCKENRLKFNDWIRTLADEALQNK